MLHSRLPRIAPRRRSETPSINPQLAKSYNIERLRPNRTNAPGESQNSASFTGDAVTGAVVVSVRCPPTFNNFLNIPIANTIGTDAMADKKSNDFLF
jgi:hypothetical protein